MALLAAVNPESAVPPLAVGNTPVMDEAGSPVALARLIADGVPKSGVTKAGELLRTREPEPVLLVVPVPPFETFKIPATVIAPVDPATGVNPVVPNPIDET